MLTLTTKTDLFVNGLCVHVLVIFGKVLVSVNSFNIKPISW